MVVAPSSSRPRRRGQVWRDAAMKAGAVAALSGGKGGQSRRRRDAGESICRDRRRWPVRNRDHPDGDPLPYKAFCSGLVGGLIQPNARRIGRRRGRRSRAAARQHRRAPVPHKGLETGDESGVVVVAHAAAAQRQPALKARTAADGGRTRECEAGRAHAALIWWRRRRTRVGHERLPLPHPAARHGRSR